MYMSSSPTHACTYGANWRQLHVFLRFITTNSTLITRDPMQQLRASRGMISNLPWWSKTTGGYEAMWPLSSSIWCMNLPQGFFVLDKLSMHPRNLFFFQEKTRRNDASTACIETCVSRFFVARKNPLASFKNTSVMGLLWTFKRGGVPHLDTCLLNKMHIYICICI